MQSLQANSTLQGGKYKIISVLGQGGFGITYLAEQVMLGRKVAIKEFFMKDLCERDIETSQVSVGSSGSVDMVVRFREKFLKEARNIAKLNHPNIIDIIDVFEENDTAYYVMKYAEGGSLASKVKFDGYLTEPVATRYILQVASALDYIHQKKMNHLDVKPSNIMLNEKDETVLIDFGLSKQYDVTSGNQTSTTPVGISEGYAPMEQYMQGGVGEFSPETDIYALGATFFKLLTGLTPPSASNVNENGVPVDELKAKGISQKAINVICKAMEGRKRDRMKEIIEFINELNDNKVKQTIIKKEESEDQTIRIIDKNPKEEKSKTRLINHKSKRKELGDYQFFALITIIPIIILASIYGIQHIKESELTKAETELETSYSNGVLKVKGVKYELAEVKVGKMIVNHKEYTLSKDYYIGKTEVTQELWTAVMDSNPSKFKNDQNPVERVNLYDCNKFINKLNKLTKKKFRLPTREEWLFAARGGIESKGYKYSGGDDLKDVGWNDNKPHNVALKRANELGIYDMTGNVLEWSGEEDPYPRTRCYFGDSPQNNSNSIHEEPIPYFYLGGNLELTNLEKTVHSPSYKSPEIGFRLVLDK